MREREERVSGLMCVCVLHVTSMLPSEYPAKILGPRPIITSNRVMGANIIDEIEPPLCAKMFSSVRRRVPFADVIASSFSVILVLKDHTFTVPSSPAVIK